MARSTLTGLGHAWAVLSFVTAVVASVAFYLPYWIRGSLLVQESPDPSSAASTVVIDTYFGSFRRCNYPRVSDAASGAVVVVVRECGRYTQFADIPSLSWQTSTVAVGLGCALALLVGLTALIACCVDDVVNKPAAKVAGILQIISALLIMVGCAIFPNGWHIREVREACGGKSDAFVLGTCTISWSLYALAASTAAILFCVVLSFKATRLKCTSYRM